MKRFIHCHVSTNSFSYLQYIHTYTHAQVVHTGKDQRGVCTVLLCHFRSNPPVSTPHEAGSQVHVLPARVLGPEPERSLNTCHGSISSAPQCIPFSISLKKSLHVSLTCQLLVPSNKIKQFNAGSSNKNTSYVDCAHSMSCVMCQRYEHQLLAVLGEQGGRAQCLA